MKVLYCLCCFVCALLYNDAAQAYFSPILKDIPYKDITENQAFTEPKPLSSDSYVKYAAVSFISKKGITSGGAAQGDDLDSMPIKETSCPDGETKVNGICIDVSSCKSSFPLTSASKGVGSYVTKNCGDGNRFCYTSCQTGWVKDGCKCVANDCGGFPLSTSSNNCNGVKSCKTGDTYKYKCTGCATGYTLSESGTCNSTKCSTYGAGYLDSLTAHCKKNDTKRNGEQHCYKCTECEDGWVLGTDFTCSAKPCSDYGATYSSSQPADCVAVETKKSGDNYCYSCKTCADGYKLSNGACVAKTCGTAPTDDLKGVVKESGIENCAKPVYIGKAGTKKCYVCSECAKGYKSESGLNCKALTCGVNSGTTAQYDIHGTTGSIDGCIEYKTIAITGQSICRQCSKCAPGYHTNGSPGTQCMAKTCGIGNSYYLQGTTTTINNCAEFESIAAAGDGICSKCKTCAKGYVTPKGAPAGVACEAATCGPSMANTYMGSAEPISNCSTYQDTGMTPNGMCRKCTACNDGYKLTGAGMACEAKTCGIGAGYDAQGTTSTINNCMEFSSQTKTGSSTCSQCKTCAPGYWNNGSPNTQCVAKTCGIGNSYNIQGTTSQVAHCVEYASVLPAGSGMCYKCKTCDSGWTLSNNACTAAGCPIGYASAQVSNCASHSTANSGNDICYKCNSCNDGWTLSGNTCNANACSGYDLSCPPNGICSTCQAGPTTKYKLDGCNTGYTPDGNGGCKPKEPGVGDVYTFDGRNIGVVFYKDDYRYGILSYVGTGSIPFAHGTLNTDVMTQLYGIQNAMPGSAAVDTKILRACNTGVDQKLTIVNYSESMFANHPDCKLMAGSVQVGWCYIPTASEWSTIAGLWKDKSSSFYANMNAKMPLVGFYWSSTINNDNRVKIYRTETGMVDVDTPTSVRQVRLAIYIGRSKSCSEGLADGSSCTSINESSIANSCKAKDTTTSTPTTTKDSQGYACLKAGYGPLNTYCVNYESCSGTKSTYYRCNQCSSQGGVAKRSVTESGITMSFCGKTCTGGYDIGGSCLPESYYKKVIKDALTYIGY